MNQLAVDLSLSNDFLENSSLFDHPLPFNFQLASSTMPIHIPDSGSSLNMTGNIKTYAPDSGPCQEYTKVILQVTGFQLLPDLRYSYTCQFSNKEVPAIVSKRKSTNHSEKLIFFIFLIRKLHLEFLNFMLLLNHPLVLFHFGLFVKLLILLLNFHHRLHFIIYL